MASANLDALGFDDVASTRPTITDGDYHVRIVEPKLETSKDGNKYIGYSVVVQSGDHAGFRIFGGIFSLKPENVWQFKRDTKAVQFEIPTGLTLGEAARFFCENAAGFEFIAKIGSKPAQVKDENGNYVPDPEGGRDNKINRWLKAVV